jgi:hypothetical protein
MFIDEGITVMLMKLLFFSNRRGISSPLKRGGLVDGEEKQKCLT